MYVPGANLISLLVVAMAIKRQNFLEEEALKAEMEKAHAYQQEHSTPARSDYKPGEINAENDADVVAETAISDTIRIRPGY